MMSEMKSFGRGWDKREKERGQARVRVPLLRHKFDIYIYGQKMRVTLITDRLPSLLLYALVPYNHSPTLVDEHPPLLNAPESHSPVRHRCPHSVLAYPTHSALCVLDPPDV